MEPLKPSSSSSDPNNDHISRKLLLFSKSFTALLGVALFVVSLVVFLFAGRILHLLHPAVDPLSDDFFYSLFQKRTWTLQWGFFASALLVAPSLFAMRPLRIPHRQWTLVAVTVSCIFFAWFIFHFGNSQFGGWDFSILIDTGWRQMIGQHPYSDFITPNPPGFNLGIYYAFRLFGVTWNAQLFAIIIFCVSTFIWMYLLFRQMAASALAALFLASAVESVTVLPVCFWWYNDVTSVLAAVFLLSALVCAQQDIGAENSDFSHAVWFSYSVSLALLSLMKPNIACPLIAAVAVLLFFAVRTKRHMLVYTSAGVVLWFTILVINHVSLWDMLISYRSVAIERGGLSHFGLTSYNNTQKFRLLLWTLLLASPLTRLLPRILTAFHQSRWRDLASLLLFTTALPITLYGMLTNGELKDSETSVLIVSCGVLCFALHHTGLWARSLFFAMLVSMIAGTVYFGVSRQRVFGIGNGQFFEYTNADRPIRDNLFHSLSATTYLGEVQQEVRQAKATFPGNIFLGPRLEFNYADLRIASPSGWPVYYQPGTSFARRDVPSLTAVWNSHHFQTLIFLGDDRTFYPDDLLKEIDNNYERQPGFDEIQVFTRKKFPLSSE